MPTLATGVEVGPGEPLASELELAVVAPNARTAVATNATRQIYRLKHMFPPFVNWIRRQYPRPGGENAVYAASRFARPPSRSRRHSSV